MDFVKLVVIVLLIAFVVFAIGAVITAAPSFGGSTWFDRLNTRQQTSSGSEVPGSPMEVVTEIIWIPFEFFDAYEDFTPTVSILGGLALSAIAALLGIVGFRWLRKVLSS